MTADKTVELREKRPRMLDEHVVKLWENLPPGDEWTKLVAAELERRNLGV